MNYQPAAPTLLQEPVEFVQIPLQAQPTLPQVARRTEQQQFEICEDLPDPRYRQRRSSRYGRRYRQPAENTAGMQLQVPVQQPAAREVEQPNEAQSSAAAQAAWPPNYGALLDRLQADAASRFNNLQL